MFIHFNKISKHIKLYYKVFTKYPGCGGRTLRMRHKITP